MEREPVRQSQSDHGNATNGASRINNTTSTTTISTTPTPTPPRLTPNPTLLDSTHPAAQTPTSSPPPPPLTPAPSLSASHVPKTVAAAAAIAGAPPPHILAPAPPRLTSTGTPILRTYSRPILPSPMAAPKMPSSAPAATILALSSSSSLRLSARSPLASNVSSSSSSSSPTVASTPPLPFSPTASSVSPSVTHGDATAPPKGSAVLTNGNARPISTHTSTAITPFHTPASPTGRQVTQALGTPGLVRANQIPTPVRQRVSQQALLLGKGLKGSGQDQALLRAQMLILTSAMRPSPSSSSRPSSSSTPSSHPASAQLQSLTLRPPPPGMLTIPPSLRLKRPISSSAPPPLSRGRTPLFPPLRPRPQPGTTATECLAMPIRPHLSVPPPTLYTPVRAVPLRPRLHSPNGHSGAPIRQSPALQPITASTPAHTSQAPPINRHLVTLKACPLSQANQSQHAALSMAASPFERSPSAARQLQIIALSSGRQSQQGNSVHAAHASVQSAPSTTVETPEPGGQLQRTLGSGDTPPLLHQPLNPSMPKTTSSSSPPLSSPPSLLCPSSPGGPSFGLAPPQTHRLLVRQGEKQGGEEQREKGRGGAGCGSAEEDIVGKDMRVNVRDDQRGAEAKEEERKGPASNMKTTVTDPLEQRSRTVTDQVERMEVTEEGERVRERTVGGEKEEEQEVEGRETPMDQAENLTVRNLHRHQNSEPNNPEPNSHPATIQNSLPEPKAMMPGLVATSSVPELSAQNQRLAEAQREPISHEDLCENMSTQSDNQSALSSLSSQSPPSSPFITPSSDRTPFLPPTSAQPARPANLSLPRHQPDKITQSQEEAEKNLDRSEDESEGNERWAPRPWPEGRQVLTHLVEGFVIQEGLQPFPVNRSSLLVESEQSASPATTPQEVNGTNGTAVFPETQRPERSEQEHSTDTDEGEGEGGATEDPGGTSQKDKVVLHCQFCGKRGHAHNFMRSKRFCSTSCARGFNVRLTKRLRALSAGSRPERPRPPLQRAESVPGKPLLLRLSRDSLQPRVLWTATRREAEEKGEGEEEEEEEEDEEKDGEEADEEEPAVVMTTKAERRGAARRTRRTASEPAMTTTAQTTPTTTYKPVPAHWSVEEVTTFILTLPGCSEVAEAFRVQEIDGQALLLLTEDHLMTSLNIKLGPALKICAHINALKHQ